MKRVLITGGAGFIGSHLAEALQAKGCEVVILDDLSTGSLGNLPMQIAGGPERLPPAIEFRKANVQWPIAYHSDSGASLVDSCDTVFHLASRVGVKAVMGDPAGGLVENMNGAVALAEMCKGKRLIVASSSEVYGKGTPPFSEDSPIVLGNSPRWSYAISKLALEHIALASDNRTTVCRLFNTVGPRQRGEYGMVLPRFVQWALRGEPLQVYGTGCQQRCFCAVEDTVKALISLAECDEAVGEIVNVGSDESVSIRDLASCVFLHVNPSAVTDSAIKRVSYEKAYGENFEDTPERAPDLCKIERLTGWKAEIPVSESIQRVTIYERGRL